MGCCKRPPKMPSKTGVSRAEIVAHAFECSLARLKGMVAKRFKAQDGNAIRSEPLQQPRASALTHSPRHCAEVPLKLGLSRGSDPRLLRLTIGGSFDDSLGSDPERQNRSHRWLGRWILHAL